MARHRTQLFLDDDQYEAVARLAREREHSIPELVHDLLQDALAQVATPTPPRQAALEGLNALRRSIETRSGLQSSDPIAEVRAERESQRDPFFSSRPDRRETDPRR